MAGVHIRITSAHWFVKQGELTPAAINFNIKRMSKEWALYPLYRTMFYQRQETGKTQFRLKDIWSCPLPSHVILAVVRASAFKKNTRQNPYNFVNYGLTPLQLTAGPREVTENAYESVYKGDVTGSSVAQEYISMLEVAGKACGHDGNLIDLASYVGESAVYCFNLTADGSEGAHWNHNRFWTCLLNCRGG